jgi:hypothetical protein
MHAHTMVSADMQAYDRIPISTKQHQPLHQEQLWEPSSPVLAQDLMPWQRQPRLGVPDDTYEGSRATDANDEDLAGRQLMCLDAGCEYEVYASELAYRVPSAKHLGVIRDYSQKAATKAIQLRDSENLKPIAESVLHSEALASNK